MYISVVIPTYNRLPILKKSLAALEKQKLTDRKIEGYEIVLVDDGSRDRTLAWLTENKAKFPHLKIFK